MGIQRQSLPQHLDWNLLRVFIVIVQEKSITNSAHRLFLTQPAVSSALKRLEDSLDTQLIDRSGRHITVTKVGERLYQECLQVQTSIANITHILQQQSLDQVYGTITVYISHHVYCPEFTDTIHVFQQSQPNIHFNCYFAPHDEVIFSVLNRNALLGLVTQKSSLRQCEEYLINTQKYGAFCGDTSPILDGQNSADSLPVSLSYAYHAESMIGALRSLMKYRAKYGLDDTVVLNTESVWSMQHMIRRGTGWGFLPNQMGQNPGLQAIVLPDYPQVSTYGIVNSQYKYNMAESMFLEYLHDHNIMGGERGGN